MRHRLASRVQSPGAFERTPRISLGSRSLRAGGGRGTRTTFSLSFSPPKAVLFFLGPIATRHLEKKSRRLEPFSTHLTSVASKRATHPAQRTGASTCRSFGAGMAPPPAKGTTRSLASPRPLSMIAAEALPPTHPRRPLVPGAFGPDPLRGPRGGRLRAFGTISE